MRAVVFLMPLLLACSPAPTPVAPPANAMAGYLADEGDHAGTISAFETRLASLKPGDDKYPETLERLALAHTELAEELDAKAAITPATAEEGRQHHLAAIERYEQLQQSCSGYEGIPASLLLVAFEHRAVENNEAWRSALDTLLRSHPDSPYAVDALLELGEDAFEANRFAEAREHYQRVRDSVPTSARTSYARYKLAWIDIQEEAFPEAFSLLTEVVLAPETQPALREQALGEAVLVYAKLPDGPAGAAAKLGPLVDDNSLPQLLEGLEKVYRALGRDELADELKSLVAR